MGFYASGRSCKKTMVAYAINMQNIVKFVSYE
jgi:hypothetical protein